jgi:malonyl-CoA decarboxylase
LPFDPVARFHLGNGAVISEVFAGADNSAKGLAQSGGVMVSYYYDLATATQNQEHYIATNEVKAMPAVQSAAATARLSNPNKKSPAHA